MVGYSYNTDREFKLLDRGIEIVTVMKRSNEVKAIMTTKTTIFLSFIL